MSHTYEIRQKETIRHTVKVNEEWKSLVETIPILPQVEMARLLAEELEKENDWSKSGKSFVKKDGNWSMEYDKESMLLSIEYDHEKVFEKEEEIHIKGYNSGYSDAPLIQAAVEEARRKMEGDSSEVKEYTEKANRKFKEEMEPMLNDIDELFQDLVQKTQIKALKSKAKNIGEIESITEDEKNGEIKIIVNI